VEPCLGFDIHRNRETKRLELVQRPRKCLYVYQYWEHPVLGWLHARIQTWFPFSGSAQEFDGIRILGRFRQIVFFQPDCRHALAFSSRYRRFFSRMKHDAV
jgi:hypothetical protein